MLASRSLFRQAAIAPTPSTIMSVQVIRTRRGIPHPPHAPKPGARSTDSLCLTDRQSVRVFGHEQTRRPLQPCLDLRCQTVENQLRELRLVGERLREIGEKPLRQSKKGSLFVNLR
jgi:hypothetical protein